MAADEPVESLELQIVGAALLELLAASADAGVVAADFQLHRRVDEIPAAPSLDESGALAVTVFTALVVPARCEGNEGMFGLPADDFMAFHFQPKPIALQAPGANGFAIQPLLLCWEGRVH